MIRQSTVLEYSGFRDCDCRRPGLEFLRRQHPGQSITEILRRIVADSVFELCAGGPKELRQKTFASVFALAERANELIEADESGSSFPEAA